MVKALLALSLSLLVIPSAWADDTTRAFTNLNGVPIPSVALLDDSSALPINPGAAGAKDLFEIYVSKSIDPNALGQFSSFLGLPNVTLGYQQFQAGSLGDLRKFSLAYTYGLTDYLSMGIGYHLSQQVNTPDSNIHSIDAGILIRPARFLSFGAAARNLNTPFVGNQQIRRSYTLGVGVRPFGERLTLTADGQWDEGDDVKNITALFGLEAEPIDGILVRGSVDLKGQFTVGAGMQFEFLNAGYFHNFNSTSRAIDSAHVQITNAIFNSALQQMGNHFAYVDLSTGFEPDNGQATPTLLNQGGPPSYWQVLQQLQLAKNLPRYKGVIVDLGSLNVGLGFVEELRQAMQDLRQAGKQVIVYMNQGGMKEYYLASAADQIVTHPMGGLNLNGFSYVMPYYKKLLDTIGASVDFIKVGHYKTGLETYTLTEASAGTLEEYAALQQDDIQRFAKTLESRRQINAEVFGKILDKTMFTSQEAKEVNLVDRIAYRDQLPQIAADLIHQPEVEIESLADLRLQRESWEPRDKIAVIYVSGGITEGSSGQDFLFGETVAGSRTIVNQIYQVRQDPSYKAIVLRVNSPGGSALGSDEIYRALMRFKELTNKPVIVSMGDVAASGGYWIALAGDTVMANPSTVTGSIGIYAGKVEFSKLYEKLGVQHTIVKTNDKADQNSNHRPYSEAERQLIQNNLRDFYRTFIERVSSSRKLDIKQVEQVAQGRVYTGAQALDIKLIDQFGTLNDAIALARQKAVIRTDEVEIVHLPGINPIFKNLADAQTMSRQGLLGGVQSSLQKMFPTDTAVMAIMDPYFGY